MTDIVLCTDTESMQYPESLGLDGETLGKQDWLCVFADAKEARSKIGESGAQEVWVAGSDEVEAINLAAAIKQDGKAHKVYLVAFNSSGSLRSRAAAAQIDDVWDKQSFVKHYRKSKAAHCGITPFEKLVKDEGVVLASDDKQISFAGKERGYLLSVLGAGGGVGKSSVAVVAAYISQSKGYKTALVDADLQFGDVAYLAGRENTLALNDALATPGRLETLACQGRHPAILSAPTRLEYSEDVVKGLPSTIDALRDRFDVVVVNTSPAWADLHLQLLEAGGNALLLLDQRPSSIRACKHALQLCARCGIATQPIVFALNRCSRHSLFSSIDVTCALKGAHVVELAEGGRDVEELLGTGAPMELLDSGNALCQSLARVLGDLLPRQQDAQTQAHVIPARRRFRLNLRRKKVACL